MHEPAALVTCLEYDAGETDHNTKVLMFEDRK